MRRALALGDEALGTTWPNPSVGAVVVRETTNGPAIVGEGVTQPGGRPHGEPVALDHAGDAAVGATLYVTLEPCAHRSVRGATPCVERTFLAGVRRAVIAIEDPNRHIAGLGVALLRSMGVSVTTGVLRGDAARSHRGHFSRVRRGRPMVTLKIARTADNYCAGPGGARLQISCGEASREVHLLRAHHDAIMVGVGTVLADDPQLTVRLEGLEHRSPVRVVLDSRLRTPTDSALFRTARAAPVWIVAAEDAPVHAEHALRGAGAEVMRVGRGGDGALDLKEALELLATRGITRVFSEGGPVVGEQLALRDLVDVMVVSTSVKRLDAPGVVAIRDGLAERLAAPGVFTLRAMQVHGDDTFEIFERPV
ncbi:MAG: riboflavin biosynthesis protein RibD [Rhizobiales bacterium 65-9]|nr:bifunctional diaminohydroxyphosphoribosylaminopyrimidine deaminase/5-amino-6-(5-phosphoribosylamino)uracil reductase RibD [Hyphomicrobiales bacterium]OJY36941.1 MAG: riboflavin biosynthesis protein RibD [Rhizobiales bacterium 65-9]